MNNRMYNAKNPFQGEHKRVLCVCSAGLLRSPTTAVVLSQPPYNFNTRAVGLDASFALIPLDDVLLEWADEIVCMNNSQRYRISEMTDKDIICLDIEDDYRYRDPVLVKLIEERYIDCNKNKEN